MSTSQENFLQLRHKMVCKFIYSINQLTILFLSQHRPVNWENKKYIKEKENTSII